MDRFRAYAKRDSRDCPFALLPKGEMLSISMNPWNGNVYLKLNSKSLSGSLALSIIWQIVRECDFLESNGSDSPLVDLMGKDGGELEEMRKEMKRQDRKKVCRFQVMKKVV